MVLNRIYKYTHAARTKQHAGNQRFTLLDGSLEELKKGSFVYSFGGASMCTYATRGYLWTSKQGGKQNLLVMVSVQSGVIPKSKWITNSGDAIKVISLADALSEGFLLYKSCASGSGTVSFVFLNSQPSQPAILRPYATTMCTGAPGSARFASRP